MQRLIIAGNTDQGIRRKDNQDMFICEPLWNPDTAILTVIDGVGGYKGGGTAAKIAKDSILYYMNASQGDKQRLLQEAVVFANNEIFEASSLHEDFFEMCCVLTAVVADAENNKLYYAHVGDTRLYILRNGQLRKITNDHSFVGEMEDQGKLSEHEAMTHPRRNEIKREVGSRLRRVDEKDFVDYGSCWFLPNDLLLICSDGLTDMLTQDQISTILNQHTDLDNKISQLIQSTNLEGGKDNITVVLAVNQSPLLAETLISSGEVDGPNDESEWNELQAVAKENTAITIQLSSPGTEPDTIKSDSFLRNIHLLALISVVSFFLGILVGYTLKNGFFSTALCPSGSTITVGDSVNAKMVEMIALSRSRTDKTVNLSTSGLGDTIRITVPIVLRDSLIIRSTDHPITFLPANPAFKGPAFRISKPGLISFECISIERFEVGIQTEESILWLKDVTFKHTAVPVQYNFVKMRELMEVKF